MPVPARATFSPRFRVRRMALRALMPALVGVLGDPDFLGPSESPLVSRGGGVAGAVAAAWGGTRIGPVPATSVDAAPAATSATSKSGGGPAGDCTGIDDTASTGGVPAAWIATAAAGDGPGLPSPSPPTPPPAAAPLRPAAATVSVVSASATTPPAARIRCGCAAATLDALTDAAAACSAASYAGSLCGVNTGTPAVPPTSLPPSLSLSRGCRPFGTTPLITPPVGAPTDASCGATLVDPSCGVVPPGPWRAGIAREPDGRPRVESCALLQHRHCTTGCQQPRLAAVVQRRGESRRGRHAHCHPPQIQRLPSAHRSLQLGHAVAISRAPAQQARCPRAPVPSSA